MGSDLSWRDFPGLLLGMIGIAWPTSSLCLLFFFRLHGVSWDKSVGAALESVGAGQVSVSVLVVISISALGGKM
jgi:hypothetical protein